MTSADSILLIEDDDAVRDVLAEVLLDEGYRVECAGNGCQALELLARTTPPDLILLDMVMPVMDGWTFREVQRRTPRVAGIPTIVLSASFPPESPRMRALQADLVLSKPVSVEYLLRSVRQLLSPVRVGGAVVPVH